MWARMSGNFAEMTTSTSFRDLLHAANLRHGTDGFTSPPKEGVLRIFFALKNPTASAGFETANLDTKGQRATPRPPKPLILILCSQISLGLPYGFFRSGLPVKSLYAISLSPIHATCPTSLILLYLIIRILF